MSKTKSFMTLKPGGLQLEAHDLGVQEDPDGDWVLSCQRLCPRSKALPVS